MSGDTVNFDLEANGKGQTRAENVAFVGDRSSELSPLTRKTILLALPALFLMFVAGSALLHRIPLWVFWLYFGTSVASFFYRADKSAALEDQWRTPENVLHFVDFVGGWPGALVAQRLFRHKTRKQSFQVVFWITVVLNCGVLAWLHSPYGAQALRAVVLFLSAGHRN
jgi:uncharacterized membrane protein YsdA (DUF1294 family)